MSIVAVAERILIRCLILQPRSALSAEAPQKIRTGFPSVAFYYISFHVAQEQWPAQESRIRSCPSVAFKTWRWLLSRAVV